MHDLVNHANDHTLITLTTDIRCITHQKPPQHILVNMRYTQPITHTHAFHVVMAYVNSTIMRGLRSGHSTGNCLLDFLSNIFDKMDNGQVYGFLFPYLRKAFGTADHTKLSEKPRYAGVKPNTMSCIGLYPEGCLLVMRVGKEVSEPLSVTCVFPMALYWGHCCFYEQW